MVSASFEVAGGDGFPRLVGACGLLGERGDAVAERVGGVVVGQVGLCCGLGEEFGDVCPGLAEGGEAGGEDGQAGVAGHLWCGIGDAGCPFADAGLCGLEPKVEAALGVVFGGRVGGRPGGPQVGVGDGVGGAPDFDPGEGVGCWLLDERGGPSGRRLIWGSVPLDAFGQLGDERPSGGEVAAPLGFRQHLVGNRWQPGEWAVPVLRSGS